MSSFGLIGRVLGHSISPFIHHMILKNLGKEGGYDLLELEEEQLKDAVVHLQQKSALGVNVTIPYKERIIDFCDNVTSQAERIGAVNTIYFNAGCVQGFNTDYYGIEETFKRMNISLNGKRAVILGTGGASRAVEVCLLDMGVERIILISRNREDVIGRSTVDSYDNLNKYEDYEILINTTPVGMYPEFGESPVEDSDVMKREFVFDLIYNPARTKLLQQAEKFGVKRSNGLYMLVVQAVKAQEIWQGCSIPESIVDGIYRECQLKSDVRNNIVLIGMPGCGKSTIGKKLGDKLNMEVMDCDSIIEEKEACSIRDIFKEHGEKKFRDIESKVTEMCALRRGVIISTGGGVIKRESNIEALKYRGKIIFINRDVDIIYEDIAKNSDRPLIQSKDSLVQLYNERKDLYLKACDHEVKGNESVETVVEEILKLLGGDFR